MSTMEIETHFLSHFCQLPQAIRLQLVDYAEFLTQKHNYAENQPQVNQDRQKAVTILQEIADSGGLGIADPQAWQRDVRQDRPLLNR